MRVNRRQVALEMIRLGDHIRTQQAAGIAPKEHEIHILGMYHDVWKMEQLGLSYAVTAPIGLVGVFNE